MQFGYFTLTDTPPAYGTGRRNPQQFVREVLHEALLAEELGFNSVWVPEHHFGLFGCLPTPAVFLAHVAAKTTRIKLAPATVLLPCNKEIEFDMSRDQLREGVLRKIERRKRKKFGD